MRFRAVADCTDYDGRFYKNGDVVELEGELHSAFLEPVEGIAEAEIPEPKEPETEKKKTSAAKA